MANTAQVKRSAALAKLSEDAYAIRGSYVHVRLAPWEAAERVRDMVTLGRTARWQNTMTAWSYALENAAERSREHYAFVLTQGFIDATHANV